MRALQRTLVKTYLTMVKTKDAIPSSVPVMAELFRLGKGLCIGRLPKSMTMQHPFSDRQL
jgi:hypothetical protein